MNDENLKLFGVKALAGLLGTLDSLLEPRNCAFPYDLRLDQASWQRRAHWLKDGLHYFKNPGTDPAERKAYARALAELEKAGLIRTGPREMAGLSVSGLELARRVCRRPDLADALPGLDFMLDLHGTRHEWIDPPTESGWFSECSLGGYLNPLPAAKVGALHCEGALWVIGAALPLLIAGFVIFGYRRDLEIPLYALSQTGEALARQRQKSGEANPSLWLKLATQAQTDLPAAYTEGWRTMEHYLTTAAPVNQNWITHYSCSNVFPRGKSNRRHSAAKKERKKTCTQKRSKPLTT